MLNKLSEGGAAPSFVSKNLERIAAENGVEVTDKTTPNQIVDGLKKKKSLYTTDRKRKQIGQPPSSVTQEVGQEEQEAPPEIQKQNEDLFKAEVAKPRAERGAFELPYSSAEETEASPTSREGLTQPQRAEQRALADMGGKVGASGPLRRLYNKVTVPYLYKVAKKSGKPTITGFSVDKVLRNIDMLAGWMERNPVAAQRIRDRTGVQSFGSPEFVAQFQAFLANQANGYRGDGKPLTLLPENDPEGMPPPTPGYTPVPVPEGAARLINSLMGVRNAFDPKADASVREAFVQRLAEANGVQVVEVNEVGEKGRTATEYNPVNKLLRDEGFDTNLFHVAIEQLRVRRMFATAKPRPDLSGLRAPVQGTIQIGYMPAPAPDTPEFKRWFGESVATDPEGNPQVYYHGTPAFEGSVFNESEAVNRTGNVQGFYFTPDPSEASWYAGTRDPDSGDRAFKSGASVIPVYLSIQRPFIEGKSFIPPSMEAAYREELEKSNGWIEPGSSWFDEKIDALKRSERVSPAALNGDGGAFQRVLRAGGYDGFRDGNHLVAFDPTQIKSATGNTGAFGQRPLTDAELSKFSLTAEEAQQAQERGDIRFMAAEPTGTPGVTETKPVVAIPSDPKAFQKVVKAIQKEPKTMASIAARVKDSERYKEMVAEVSDLPPLDPARMQAEEDALADGTEAEINRRARARYKAQGGAFTSVTFSLLDATKTKASLAKNVIDANPTRLFDKLDSAKDMLARDPERIASPAGFGEYMKAAGMSGDILSAPPMLGTMLQRPEDYVALLQGGYHGDRTKPGTMEAADAGLDSTVRMREAINGRPPELVTALHSLWGILSRMLAPIHQEAMWLRLVSTPYIMDQIQASVDGNFNLTKDEWKTMVRRAKLESDSFSDKLGNPGVSNANAFYLMLTALNGKWDLMSDVYAAPNSTEMGRRFWSLGVGKLGIRNKVQRFIGLTFGIPALIMDRWKFVEFYFQQFGKPPQDYFIYDSGNTPEDPNGIYGFYGPYEGKNNPLSLAMYEGFELAVNAAIANSGQLRTVLGRHANLGGMHWKGWNAIKNEAVGHSSLDLTYDLVQKNPNPTAQDVLDLIKTKDYYTEGLVGTEIKRFTLPRNR